MNLHFLGLPLHRYSPRADFKPPEPLMGLLLWATKVSYVLSEVLTKGSTEY